MTKNSILLFARDRNQLSKDDFPGHRLFAHYFSMRAMPVVQHWVPAVDVYETAREIVVVVDLAGVDTRELKIFLEDNELFLRGTRHEPATGIKREYHTMEIDYGPFERRITLPKAVDATQVATSYQQGFLEIRLPKVGTAGLHHIEIEVG